jgi:2-C-methyl-D-erythritol 4-phosphate cytidylyltransferase/2-C-methyl-D-erythritol 2,4-cyclodiphosphate synthase
VASVVCHDAARPFASSELFAAVLAGLDEGADGVIPVVGVPDTVKRVEADAVVETVPRQELRLAQTPQAFRSGALADAHARAATEAKTFTDDAAMLEWAGYKVHVVEGEAGNFKITTAADFARAEEILRG